jgi:hypothetical protein
MLTMPGFAPGLVAVACAGRDQVRLMFVPVAQQLDYLAMPLS